MTHLPEEPCPFEADDNPVGFFCTCCSLRGKVAAHELEALGETRLSESMYEDKEAEDAIAFAVKLNKAADKLERDHAGDADKPKGASWGETWDSRRKTWTGGTQSTFEEAIAAIRQAARWYDKVGRLGFGVHAR